MTTAILKAKRALLATGAAAALILIASTANAGCRMGYDDDGNRVQLCTSGGSYAMYDEDDEDEDEDEDYEEADEFIYDQNQGSLLVDQSDCEPGKYWMMEGAEFDVPMPCR